MINPFTGGLEFRRLKKKEEEEDEDFPDINSDFCPVQSSLSIDEKVKLVKNGQEDYGLYNSKKANEFSIALINSKMTEIYNFV